MNTRVSNFTYESPADTPSSFMSSRCWNLDLKATISTHVNRVELREFFFSCVEEEEEEVDVEVEEEVPREGRQRDEGEGRAKRVGLEGLWRQGKERNGERKGERGRHF